MNLIINLSKEKPSLILKNHQAVIDQRSNLILNQLSENLIREIDVLLSENHLNLFDLGQIKVIKSKLSLAGNRIARACVLGLRIGQKQSF